MYRFAIPIVGIRIWNFPIKLSHVELIKLDSENLPPNSDNDGWPAISYINFDKEKKNFRYFDFLEDVLSLLRLYVFKKYQDGMASINIISRRKLKQYSESYILDSIEPNNSTKNSLMPRRRAYYYKFRQKDVDNFVELGLNNMIELLHKSHSGIQLTKLDRIILTSSLWAGNMLEDADYKDCILRGVTAVETLTRHIRIEGGIGKKFKIGGGAFYVSDIDHWPWQDPYPGFKRIILLGKLHELKLIYQSRCDISHKGKSDFSDSNITWKIFENLVGNICFNAILKWNKCKDYDEYYNSLEIIDYD